MLIIQTRQHSKRKRKAGEFGQTVFSYVVHETTIFQRKKNCRRGFARSALTCYVTSLEKWPLQIEVWGTVWGFSRGFERGMLNLLAKACAQARIKVIGVKTMMITSATCPRRLQSLEEEEESRNMMDDLVVFCQEV